MCGIALTLPLHAQNRGKAQEVRSADYYMEHYLFDDAERLLKQDIAKLKRKRHSTANEERKLQQIDKMRSMMEATEQVVFIDSLVVDKATFLEHIRLSPESGSISSYADFFNRPDEIGCTVYMSELGNKICFSQAEENGDIRLYTSNLVGQSWETPRMLEELEGDDQQNYPFMLSDGITLYYAAQGDESIGGYDIFVTRYDSDEKKFLYPENIGMPFNSPANDYMLAIDEFNKIGWFVSDRNQPEDKVCIYIFIPNDIRKVYSAGDMDEKALIRLASISSISETWGDKFAVESARARLADATRAMQAAEQKKDFELVINDGITYTLFTDFRSAGAGKLAAKWKQDAEQLARQKESLQALRDKYAKANATAKKQMREQILKAEAQYEKAETALHEQEKQIRNMEIRKLQQ